ncbi:unnamed protein product [Echinostoma caproni]|uniref:Uncharacterized protein n=1 Tax=Echinostoma caproni TaxID=27848 RepID=A0A183B9K1_9TREM|nr:unnamed protein product [Echinostoma caproni]
MLLLNRDTPGTVNPNGLLHSHNSTIGGQIGDDESEISSTVSRLATLNLNGTLGANLPNGHSSYQTGGN